MTLVRPRGGATRTVWLLFASSAACALFQGCIARELDGGKDATLPGFDGGPAPIDSGPEVGADSSVSTDADAGPPLPLVEIGTGYMSFISAPDGSSVDVHQGPQGGFHVFVSLRITNLLPGDSTLPSMDPAQPSTRVIATDAVGTVLADQTLTFPYASVSGVSGLYELLGWTEVLAICACAVVTGEPITVSAIVTDSAGSVAMGSRTWMAVDSPKCTPPVPPCI